MDDLWVNKTRAVVLGDHWRYLVKVSETHAFAFDQGRKLKELSWVPGNTILPRQFLVRKPMEKNGIELRLPPFAVISREHCGKRKVCLRNIFSLQRCTSQASTSPEDTLHTRWTMSQKLVYSPFTQESTVWADLDVLKGSLQNSTFVNFWGLVWIIIDKY
jgi:hypothetical protein